MTLSVHYFAVEFGVSGRGASSRHYHAERGNEVNRLATYNGQVVQFDADGNLLARVGWTERSEVQQPLASQPA